MKLSNIIFVFFTVMLLVCGFGFVEAQTRNSHPERLPWVEGKLPQKKGDYDYMVARGSGSALSEARDNAMNDLLIDLGNNAGVTINSATISEIKNQLSFDGKQETYTEENVTVSAFRIEREGFNASFSKVGEYYERSGSGYELWALYEVSITGSSFKPYIPEYTNIYGMSAGWRSAVVPSWGQFHKGKTAKGVLFLSAELVAISGIVICEMQRADNMRKSQETTNLSIIMEYRNRADNWELFRNLAIGTAVGVYVWNVLDAALAKGKIKYAWMPNNLNLWMDGGYYGVAIRF